MKFIGPLSTVIPEIFESAFDCCFVGGVFVERMKKFVDQILPENDFVVVQILHRTLKIENRMETMTTNLSAFMIIA